MKLATNNQQQQQQQPLVCCRTNSDYERLCASSSKMTFDDVIMTSDGDAECNLGDDTECVTCHSITVCKTNANDRIGLTLLYRQTDCDGINDVIVDQIDPNSAISECDIQRGDLIVEINGTPVRSRDQVLKMLGASAGLSRINVLLARRDVTRQLIDVEDDDDFDAGFDDDDDGINTFTSLQHFQSVPPIMNMYNVATGRMLECIDEEDDLTDAGGECTSQHQSEEIDSGLSKTDESIRNDESSEQDTDSPTGFSPHSRFRGGDNISMPRRPSALSINTNDGNFVLLPSNHIARPPTSIPYRQHSRQTSPTSANSYHEIDLMTGKPPLPPRCRSVPRTTKHPQETFDHVTVMNGINRLMISEDLLPATKPTAYRRVPRMGTRLNLNAPTATTGPLNLNVSPGTDQYKRQNGQCLSPDHDYCVIAETSRRAESFESPSPGVIEARSSPLHLLDISRVCSPPPLPYLPLTSRFEVALPLDVDEVASRSHHCPTTPTGYAATSRGTQTLAVSDAYQQCADVMYTNHANLQHTIAVQQRLFRQQLADRHRRQCTSPTTITPKPPPRRARESKVETLPSSHHQGNQRIEWIVRRRSDGSRYVTRRPACSSSSSTRLTAATDSIRSHVTSSKTSPGSNGRHFAETWTTTDDDDDDGESPKAGRYWTREQRRQHVADRRRREALKQQAKEAAEASGELVSPTDSRVRRGLNRARRALVSDLAVVDGLTSGHNQRTGIDVANIDRDHRRLFNASGQLLSVATV